MPMKMGIHFKPIGHGHSTSLDSRVRGNPGGMFFPRKRLRVIHEKSYPFSPHPPAPSPKMGEGEP
ncbi:MAG: hypothetical protein AAFY26_26265, partial [Cyanobacteria bacterium J06638_22]